jgi:hypothetical protein
MRVRGEGEEGLMRREEKVSWGERSAVFVVFPSLPPGAFPGGKIRKKSQCQLF